MPSPSKASQGSNARVDLTGISDVCFRQLRGHAGRRIQPRHQGLNTDGEYCRFRWCKHWISVRKHYASITLSFTVLLDNLLALSLPLAQRMACSIYVAAVRTKIEHAHLIRFMRALDVQCHWRNQARLSAKKGRNRRRRKGRQQHVWNCSLPLAQKWQHSNSNDSTRQHGTRQQFIK